MKLLEDVTFDSLGAVRQELSDWFAPNTTADNTRSSHPASRDLLVAVLIHRLADELSDVRVRSQIYSSLSDLQQSTAESFTD